MYPLRTHFGRGDDVLICTDASTIALGGFLALRGVIVAYFSSSLSDSELDVLGHVRGCAKGQQTFEALAILVALRLWSSQWAQSRARPTVRSDSVSALTVLIKFKAAGRGPSIVAREIALEYAQSTYAPTLAQHVSGLANSTCDILSRPEQGRPLPDCLRSAQHVSVPSRDASWFRTVRS